MLSVRVIPSLLLQGRGLVKTRQFKDPKYIGDPINAVKIFNEKGVDELIFLDIMATRENRPPAFEVLSTITSECFMPLGFGGGVSTIEHVKRVFGLGVEKVILNSAVFQNPGLVEEAAAIYGSQSVVVAIDVKKTFFGKYTVVSECGRKNQKLDPVDHAIEMVKRGAGEIFVTSVDQEGTMEGYDLELTGKISRAVSVPVVANGGAGSVQDFGKAIRAGASAVSAGSLFVFHGPHRAVLINIPDYSQVAGLSAGQVPQ